MMNQSFSKEASRAQMSDFSCDDFYCRFLELKLGFATLDQFLSRF